MADLTAREGSTTTETSALEQLVKDSTVSYSRPVETQPSIPTSVAIATALSPASTTPTGTSTSTSSLAEAPSASSPTSNDTGAGQTTYTAPVSSTPPILTLSQPITTNIMAGTLTVASRPLVGDTLMIDPVSGTTVPISSGGGFGGGGAGMMPEEKSATKAVQKKSWMPALLIATGLILIATKIFGKKKTAK